MPPQYSITRSAELGARFFFGSLETPYLVAVRRSRVIIVFLVDPEKPEPNS